MFVQKCRVMSKNNNRYKGKHSSCVVLETKGRRMSLVYHVHIKRAPDISDKLSLYKAYTIMIIPFFKFFFAPK